MLVVFVALASLRVGPQDPAVVRPISVDARERGIRSVAPLEGPAERIVALDFPIAADREGVERLPLARAVSDVDLAVFPDESFVVLAGGVREDLDIYRFDVRTHLVERYATVGGRRLASTFASGLGSRPVLLGPGLALFAFEKENGIRFRAATPRRTVAERTLPLDCGGFRARFDLETYLVVIEFVGEGDRLLDRLEFLHPIAPRLVLEGAVGGAVAFDPVSPARAGAHALILHNQGSRPLPLRFWTEGPFDIEPAGTSGARVEPGAGQELRIRFRGGEPGEHVGRLEIASAVAGVSTEILLRAVVAAAATVDAPPPPIPRDRAGVLGPTEDGVAKDRPSVPPVAPLRLDSSSAVSLRWRDARSVLVGFRLAPDEPAPGIVRIVNGRTGEVTRVPVDDHRRVAAVVRAMAFDPLAVTGVGSEPLAGLCEVPPALALDGACVVVHAPPDASFLLVQVEERLGERRLIGRGPRWQGRTNALGLARIDSSLLAVGPTATHFALVVMAPDGDAVLSEPIEIGPSTPPSGGDRAK